MWCLVLVFIRCLYSFPTDLIVKLPWLLRTSGIIVPKILKNSGQPATINTGTENNSKQSTINTGTESSTNQSKINMPERCCCKSGNPKGHYHCRMCLVVSTRKTEIVSHERELHGTVPTETFKPGLGMHSRNIQFSSNDDYNKVTELFCLHSSI